MIVGRCHRAELCRELNATPLDLSQLLETHACVLLASAPIRAGALDPSVEQASSLDGRRAEIRDPLLEHGRPRVQLLERQLGCARLEPSRLRRVRGRAPRQPSHRSAVKRFALIGREPPQPERQAREPLPPASADREQLAAGIANQVAQRGADELHRGVPVGGVEVIDPVDDDQKPGHSAGCLEQQVAFGLRQRLPRIQHADRRVGPGEEIARDGRVVTVDRSDPGGVDQLESAPSNS